MSREAKIGLLVALAFLLVIGLLLSDQVTSVTREPPAPLASTADAIRRGLTVPGQPSTGVILPAPQQREPQQPHVYEGPTPPVTRLNEPVAELQVERGHVQLPDSARNGVNVAGYDQGAENPAHLEAWAGSTTVDIPGGQPGINPLSDGGEALSRRPLTDPFAELQQVASQAGEPVDRVEEPKKTSSVDGVTDYTAQPGDTLGAMAKRFLGSDNRDNRQKLIALNPALRDNPDLIVAGHSYRVPARESAVARGPASTGSTPSSGGKTYTVKSGDNLWKIAKRELGSSARRAEIIALNRDVLADPDNLKVGMTLRLPG